MVDTNPVRPTSSDDEVERYLDEHPNIILLFEVDVAEAVTLYVTHREDEFDEKGSSIIATKGEKGND